MTQFLGVKLTENEIDDDKALRCWYIGTRTIHLSAVKKRSIKEMLCVL